MSDGLIDFISADLATNNDQLGEDGKDGKTYLVKLSKKYTGEYDGQSFRLKKGHRIAVKTFKTKKSVNKIRKEAEYQHICAQVDISPAIYGVHYEEKYIAMDVDQRYMEDALSIIMKESVRSRQRALVPPSQTIHSKNSLTPSASSKSSCISGTLDLLISSIVLR